MSTARHRYRAFGDDGGTECDSEEAEEEVLDDDVVEAGRRDKRLFLDASALFSSRSASSSQEAMPTTSHAMCDCQYLVSAIL